MTETKRKTGPEVRSERARSGVMETLREIAAELENSSGIYPHGKLTMAEIRRRSGASRNLLYAMPEVADFLGKYKDGLPKPQTGRSVPKPDHLRALDAQKRANGMLIADHSASSGRLNEAMKEIARLREKLAERDEVIAALRSRLDPDVTPIAMPKKGYWDD